MHRFSWHSFSLCSIVFVHTWYRLRDTEFYNLGFFFYFSMNYSVIWQSLQLTQKQFFWGRGGGGVEENKHMTVVYLPSFHLSFLHEASVT